MTRLIFAFAALLGLVAPAMAEPVVVKVGVLRQAHARETISTLDIPADNETLAGVELGADDNNTTGQFTNQAFETIDVRVDAGEDIAEAVTKLADAGAKLVVADLPAARLLAAASAGATHGMVFINSSAARRSPARKPLPVERVSCGAVAVDAGRRARAISGVEAMEALAAGQGFTSR